MGLFDHCSDISAAPQRADTRRQRVIEKARFLFTQNGFHGTGMAQIAEESGVKVGQIYRDFPSKEAIVAAIVEADMSAFLDEAALAEAVAAGDRPALRRWIIRFLCDKVESREKLIPEICAEASRNERIAAIMDAVNARVCGDLSSALSVFATTPARMAEVPIVVDLVLTVAIGLASQRAMGRLTDMEALCTRIEAIVDRELARLAGTDDAVATTAAI